MNPVILSPIEFILISTACVFLGVVLGLAVEGLVKLIKRENDENFPKNA